MVYTKRMFWGTAIPRTDGAKAIKCTPHFRDITMWSRCDRVWQQMKSDLEMKMLFACQKADSGEMYRLIHEMTALIDRRPQYDLGGVL